MRRPDKWTVMEIIIDIMFAAAVIGIAEAGALMGVGV